MTKRKEKWLGWHFAEEAGMIVSILYIGAIWLILSWMVWKVITN